MIRHLCEPDGPWVSSTGEVRLQILVADAPAQSAEPHLDAAIGAPGGARGNLGAQVESARGPDGGVMAVDMAVDVVHGDPPIAGEAA